MFKSLKYMFFFVALLPVYSLKAQYCSFVDEDDSRIENSVGQDDKLFFMHDGRTLYLNCEKHIEQINNTYCNLGQVVAISKKHFLSGIEQNPAFYKCINENSNDFWTRLIIDKECPNNDINCKELYKEYEKSKDKDREMESESYFYVDFDHIQHRKPKVITFNHNDKATYMINNINKVCRCSIENSQNTPTPAKPVVPSPPDKRQPKKGCICDKYDIERIKNERIGNCIEAENKKKEIIERCEKIKNKKSDQICDWFTELKNDFNRNIEKCKNDEENYIRSKYSKIELKLKSLDISVWKDKEGNFNKTRLISDSVAGVVLGTAGGLITSSVIKKNQIENGFEDISCAIGGQIVSSYGDEFTVGIH